jgi:hypothetical protein
MDGSIVVSLLPPKSKNWSEFSPLNVDGSITVN